MLLAGRHSLAVAVRLVPHGHVQHGQQLAARVPPSFCIGSGCRSKPAPQRRPWSSHQSEGRHVTLSDLATYIYSQINGTFDDIHVKLSEAAAILGYANDGSITQVTLSDAELLIEDVGACPQELESFLAEHERSDRGLAAWRRPEEDPVGASCSDGLDITAEYEAYPADKHLVALARKRGARVECTTSSKVRIIAANGVSVVMPSLRGKEYGSNIRDIRLRLLRDFRRAGIRPQDFDANGPRWCTWCRRFQSPDQIGKCPAGHFSCLKFE
mmetsp:Transcript_122164/g.380348  ORF Transcript_122164/g.380348 Transcript_122164/m.380348 type:complete len:270 (-) Transcript_122164:57-866(-)